MKLNFNEFGEFVLSIKKSFIPEPYGYVNSAVILDADYEAQLKDYMIMPTSDFLTFNKINNQGKSHLISYTIVDKSIDLDLLVEEVDGLNCVKQSSVVKNNDAESHNITQLACTNINGICYNDNGIAERLSDGSIKIYYCINRWQGEAQWRAVTPEDVGVYPCSKHVWEKNIFRIDSTSSWTTREYYPIIIIEDKLKNQTFFAEYEGVGSWFMELYSCFGDNVNFLSLKIGGADERLGFSKRLESGDSFVSDTCVYGLVDGDYQQAIKELTKYKRKATLVPFTPPVIFNDFMNCNWALPTREKLIPLIDKAAEVGAEIFCIDDGWAEQGEWVPLDHLFGEGGLQYIIDYIRSKGMKAGLWFEFERASERVKEKFGIEDYYQERNGKIIAQHRKKVNFKSKKAKEYVKARIADAYKMGVRYIKNDHNNVEDQGITLDGVSAGEGAIIQAKLVNEFVDQIRVEYPDLIIENCGAGATRSSFGILKHFHVQSITDQEDYVKNASILAGTLAVIPSEKAGCWSYPYPLFHKYYDHVFIPDDVIKEVSGKEQTVFNMINAMLGCIFLSGKINQMDDESTCLVKHAIEIYKENREFICNAYPVYPQGFFRMSDKTNNSVGLISDNKEKLLLAVYNLSDSDCLVSVDLSEYGLSQCKQIYPNYDSGEFSYDGKILQYRFNNAKSARLFELKK